MMNQASSPPRSHSAQVSLYRDSIYVFSDMLVDRLGTMPLRLVAQFEVTRVTPLDLGKAVRQAIAGSLSWVEWEEFEKLRASYGEPVSKALRIPNKDMNKADKQSGLASVADWPNKLHYVCTPWVKKGASGKPLTKAYPILAKDCSDEQLGSQVLECLRDSLAETLAANKK